MEKLTLKLKIINKTQVKYSVLEQSPGIRKGIFEFDFYSDNENMRVKILSTYTPNFYYFERGFFVIRLKGLDSRGDYSSVAKTFDFHELKYLSYLLSKSNIKKLKQELAKRNIDFRLVTNSSLNSKF
jgi:hypothetical protein